MIYLEMFGRTGNQLFRYAMARALQLKYYPDEPLVISFLQINEAAKADPTFYNALEDYQVAPYQIYDQQNKVLFAKSSWYQKLILTPYYLGLKKFKPEQMTQQFAYQKRWEKLLNHHGLYWFRTGYIEPTYSTARDKFVSGNFESKVYFDEFKDILLKELTPKQPLLEKNISLMNKIESSQAVCLSVRRGDFESNDSFKGLHSVCDKTYFEKAVKVIKEKVENPVFFMFSDDIEWVKNNIQTGAETYYETGDDPVWEKLRLMSACKHFILSNSSFSWWSQYLSQYDDKIIVSPSKWFNNDYQADLIEKDWLLIDVER